MTNGNPDVVVDKRERRETPIFGTRVTPELLELVDEAIEASEGKYTTRPELARDAIELYARYIKEGRLKRVNHEEPEALPEEDQKYEASVEAALDLIQEFEHEEFEDIEEFSEEFAREAKGGDLPITVWSNSKIQKAMRKLFHEEIYPIGAWDEKRKFRKKKAGEWVEALRKQLRIPRSVARELIENPDLKGLELYQEWF